MKVPFGQKVPYLCEIPYIPRYGTPTREIPIMRVAVQIVYYLDCDPTRGVASEPMMDDGVQHSLFSKKNAARKKIKMGVNCAVLYVRQGIFFFSDAPVAVQIVYYLDCDPHYRHFAGGGTVAGIYGILQRYGTFCPNGTFTSGSCSHNSSTP